jgi:hypothetical protein
MELFHWYLLSNIVWPIFIVTMIMIKASWFELIIVAVILNLIGLVSIPTSYYVTIFINIGFFIAFLYGSITDKLKNNSI